MAVVGGLDEPELMGQVLASGKPISSPWAAPLLPMPMPGSFRGGRADDVTPCIRCNHCISGPLSLCQIFLPPDTMLRQSGSRARIYRKDVPARLIPKVLVIGGSSPAGMEAATHAARHPGTPGYPGGKIRPAGRSYPFAGHVSFKSKLDRLCRY